MPETDLRTLNYLRRTEEATGRVERRIQGAFLGPEKRGHSLPVHPLMNPGQTVEPAQVASFGVSVCLPADAEPLSPEPGPGFKVNCVYSRAQPLTALRPWAHSPSSVCLTLLLTVC